MFQIFCVPILQIGFGLTGETLKEATEYLRIFSISIPLNLLIFLYSSVFKIYRKTNHIFVVALFVNILNVFFDYIFIYGKLGLPELGAKGAALGSVLSLFVCFVIYWYIARKYIQFTFKVSQLLQKMKAKIIFSIPFIGQEFLEDILFVVGVNMIVARMGTIELSVYNLILQMIAMIQMPMFGYAAATISLVGEEQGRKNRKKIRTIKKIVTILALIWFVIMYVVLVTYKYNVITFITDEIDILPLAQQCIPIALMGQVFNYGINIEKAALQCMGDEKYTLYATFIINMIVLFLCAMVHKLSLLYIVLGIGYGGLYAMLCYRSSQKLNVSLKQS